MAGKKLVSKNQLPWQEQDEEWVKNWKFRLTPAARSRVLQGKGVESDKEYTERRKKETTKRTWRSDAADIAHGIGEGVLAIHPYTAIPYFGAKVGQDILNGNVSWQTALNASVPLFYLSPQITGVTKATKHIPKKSSTDAQLDAAHRAAYETGNIAEGQRLRDLHFKSKAPNSKAIANGVPIKSYHTVADAYPADFTEFNPTIEGTHSAIYTSDSPIMSGTYSSKIVSDAEREYYINAGIENMKQQLHDGYVRGSYKKGMEEALKSNASARDYVTNQLSWLKLPTQASRQKALYINIENPLIIEGEGRHWNNIPIGNLPKDVYKELKASGMNGYTTRDIEQAQKAVRQYDGAIIKDITDYGGSWKSTTATMKPSTVYQVNDPRNLKSAEPFTFDDSGNLIPLSQRDNFNVGDIRYFSQQPIVRAVPEHTAVGNPLQTRLTRLQNHANYGTDVAGQAILVKPIIRGNEIRSVAKQLEPNLTDSDLDLISQIVYANRKGAHIPIESGKRASGISVVDIQEAINYLKESGIKNPNAYDVGIIAGHEAGHGVQVSPKAKQLVQDFVEPEEFYTRAGQILDDAGVFETSQNPVSFGKFMQFIDDYLKRGNLDNGIFALKQYMQNISSPIKRQQVMGAINRFSVGTGSAYLLNNGLNE